MEVAGLWRREWAGTAEFGDVIEGGVTRRIARAMEVMNASAPGARMRVMRAAYHSSAGPGAPAASYMVHSSRRVISSGSSFLESPSFKTLPLEISSTPLESSPERENENYKVTEPDDFDISEPSKWKRSTGSNSVRMPSEESSSADTASIIELDHKPRNSFRKHSYDSEISDTLKNIQSFRKNSYDSEISDTPSTKTKSTIRASPILESPTDLSTLKYKSLLNSNNDWNSRRKSYSFEDTVPLNETIIHSNDTLAMESSTDSGICKSTELVDDNADDNTDDKYNNIIEDNQKDTFKDWLSRNRVSSFQHKSISQKEYDVPSKNNITLQSNGRVSITLENNSNDSNKRPFKTTQTTDTYQYKKVHASDDGDRKVKRVEFCKTELHFTADTGIVNIIATDEKPPPSNDFRKRRSAFVPLKEKFEKPIMLFGDRVDENYSKHKEEEKWHYLDVDPSENDENTSGTTKSILKNKIPKPKPYLLGENMVFGDEKEPSNSDVDDIPAAVSLINRQLQPERRYSDDTYSSFLKRSDVDVVRSRFGTKHTGPTKTDAPKQRIIKIDIEGRNQHSDETKSTRNKVTQMSPLPTSFKIRQLRDSDASYRPKYEENNEKRYSPHYVKENSPTRKYTRGDTLHSVRLVKDVSSSVCSSEPETEEIPTYQNVPIKTNFAPIPIPRTRTKFDKDIENLTPRRESTERDENTQETRRSRHRRYEDVIPANRSISEPPKPRKRTSINQVHETNRAIKESPAPRRKLNDNVSKPSNVIKCDVNKSDNLDEGHLYANYKIRQTSKSPSNHSKNSKIHDAPPKPSKRQSRDKSKTSQTLDTIKQEDDAKHQLNSHTRDRSKAREDSYRKKPEHEAIKKQRSRSSHNYHSSEIQNYNSKDKNCSHKSTQREPSKHRETTKRESPDKTVTEHKRDKSTQRKQHEKDTRPDSTGKSDSYKKSSRNKYVINYDDKDGTVSSVCKMKPGFKREQLTNERNVKTKASEKNHLLQYPDEVFYSNTYGPTKWKNKVHKERSCQIL